MSSRFAHVLVALVVVAVAGAIAARVQPGPGVASPGSAAAAVRSGRTAALLGGYRVLVGNLLWVRLHAHWERRDLTRTHALLRQVTSISPRTAYFWRNGARIVAYDFAAWRIEAAGGYAHVSSVDEARVQREQAEAAIAFLEEALRVNPRSAELWIERANIEYARLADFAAAAESYRRAALSDGAPKHASRLHAEMLRRAGRQADAHAWLVNLHPTLHPDNDDDAADLVLARIRELERELGLTKPQRYVSPAAAAAPSASQR